MSKGRIVVVLAAVALAATLVVIAGALASSGPAVSGESASAVSDTGATLSATVNPAGQTTSYAFEYGTSEQYSVQTAVQSAGTGTSPVVVSTPLSGLRPGTTYHYRLLATSGAGTTAGSDATFKTTGIAPPEPASAQPSTGAATGIGTDSATLNGTVTTVGLSAGETETYYFQLGPSQPYSLQTVPQTLKAGSPPVAVKALVSGLASAQLVHYRLVTVTEGHQVAVGPDRSFSTLPRERLHPAGVAISASPAYHRAMPDRVTVSGRMVPPPGMSDFIACRGYFDITFRVGQIAVQSLRAGIHKDCTFSLPVVFHNRRRLMGGRVTVHVLFAGNRFLHRLEAPTRTIQVG
jgi:hypothetical protein